MSLSTSYRTEIVIPQPQLQAIRGNVKGVPCMDILLATAEKIAGERGGQIGVTYRDVHGKTRPCLLSIQTKELPNGLGICVGDDGLVRFEFDAQGANIQAADALCNDLARAYAVIAVMRAQKRAAYKVRVVKDDVTPTGHVVDTIAVGD